MSGERDSSPCLQIDLPITASKTAVYVIFARKTHYPAVHSPFQKKVFNAIIYWL
jgi:hypothetical protein